MAQKTVAYTAGVTPGSYTSADITVDNQGLITTVASGSGGSAPPNPWAPSDYVAGGLTWTGDIANVVVTSSSSGQLRTCRIKLPSAISVSNISFYFANNTATFTAGQNFVGLYQGNTLVGSSADQAAAWQGVGAGLQTAALVGAPIALSAGFVDVAFLAVYSAGTITVESNPPGVLAGVGNAGMSSPNFRGGAQTGLTALPADLNSTTATGVMMWFALS